jgi:DNA-binding CsgD family transcriptional regulator
MSDGPAFLTPDEWVSLRTALRLSPREGHVVSLIINGMQDMGIADQCGISLDTVRTHIRRIYTKVGRTHARS